MKRCILIFIILALSVAVFAGGKQETEGVLASEINILMDLLPALHMHTHDRILCIGIPESSIRESIVPVLMGVLVGHVACEGN